MFCFIVRILQTSLFRLAGGPMVAAAEKKRTRSSDMLRMFKWVKRLTVNMLILFHITKHCSI